LEHQLSLINGSPLGGLRPWSKPPAATTLGLPIDLATGLHGIEPGPKFDADSFKENPGSFYVACGLALQGIGRAPLSINLRPPDEGVLGSLSRITKRVSTRAAWGIDVGRSALKAVKLASAGQLKQRTVVIEHCDLVDHRKPLAHALNELEERTLIEETFRRFLARNHLKGERVCIGLPGMLSITRQIKIPPVEASKVSQVMQYEARLHLPVDLDQLIWGHQFLGTDGKAPNQAGHREMILLAVRREAVRHYLDKFRDLNLNVSVVQSACIALHNYLVFAHFGGQGDPEAEVEAERPPILALDMGAEGTNIVVSAPRTVWSRYLGLGGAHLTKIIVREFGLTMAQAEELKRNPSQARRISQIYEAASPVFRDFLKEVKSSLEHFTSSDKKQRIDRVLCLGGGFQFHGLARFLRTGR
jgi:type IV pilus assembly protein PilM